MKKYLLLMGVLFLFFSSIHSINAYVLSGYVFDSSNNPLANFPVELEDETEAAEHLFSVSSNALSTPSSTKLYLRGNDLLSKEAPTSSGYYSENFRYGASAEWSYTLDGDIDGSYYAFNILLYAYQTTCNLKIIHKKQSGGETILVSWTGISTSDPNYYQWVFYDTNSGVNPDASSGDKIIFRVTSANNDKWVSVRFGGVNVQSYILIPSPVGALYNITLYKGWNLISFPLNLTNKSIKDVFNNINFKSIFSYGSWFYYFNETKNNFNEINESNGYWVNSLNNQTLTIEGNEFSYPINISLNQGWNLIGYPSLNSSLINETLKDINYSIIYTYNNSNWLSYAPNRNDSLNTLKYFKPGYGYWVR